MVLKSFNQEAIGCKLKIVSNFLVYCQVFQHYTPTENTLWSESNAQRLLYGMVGYLLQRSLHWKLNEDEVH